MIGFLYPNEVLNVFEAVNLKTYYVFRDYTILNLLYDSVARASEMAVLTIDFFDPENDTLAILGKGNQYRQIELLPKNGLNLLKAYIKKYRKKTKPSISAIPVRQSAGNIIYTERHQSYL